MLLQLIRMANYAVYFITHKSSAANRKMWYQENGRRVFTMAEEETHYGWDSGRVIFWYWLLQTKLFDAGYV